MSSEINKQVDKKRKFFKKVQPQNHPIKDHPVAGCDEYVKEIYFDMLCVIAMYENDDTENQNRFIQRLMAGSGDTIAITDHIKRAMEISTEKVNEFICQVQSNNLVNIFFIDSLIISCANGSPNRKQTKFLAELGDALGLNKDSIKLCSELTVGILEQNFNKIIECIDMYDNIEVIFDSANCYIKPMTKYIVNQDISSVPNKIHYYSSVISDASLFSEYKTFENYDRIVMENIIFYKPLTFISIKEVKLTGCVFENMSYSFAVSFSGVQKVIIENCKFKHLKGVLWFSSSDIKVTISNSLFEDCYNDFNDCGCIITSDNYTKITLNNCVFKDIASALISIISYNNDITANNCNFINCNIGFILFDSGSLSGTNNTYKNCASIRGL